MDYMVIKEHVSNYPDPIQLKSGDLLTVLEHYVGPEGWDNWKSCISIRTGKKGWVPEQVIEIEARTEKAIAMQDYDANELNVQPGTLVKGIEKLNGWIWCQHSISHELGWLPLNVLEEIKEF